MKILKNKDNILFSESLIWDLKKDHNEREIKDMLNLLFINNILFKIEITKKEFQEAKKLSQEINIPLTDCLNVIQAKNHKAIMVSQDKHYFKNLSDITKTIKPQEIISN